MNSQRLIVLGIIIVILVGLYEVFGNGVLSQHSTLSVIGEGSASGKPASVVFVVTNINSGTDVVKAINEGDASMAVYADTIRSIAGGDSEIQASFNSVTPGGSTALLGQPGGVRTYQVANALRATIKDYTKINEIVKTLYSEGATTVGSVSFIPEQADAIDDAARLDATQNAQKKAESLAKSMKKKLGRVVSVTEDNQVASSAVGSSTAQKSNTTLLNTIDITKRVSVVYEIW